jgi:hypothetical protein
MLIIIINIIISNYNKVVGSNKKIKNGLVQI